MIKHILWMLFIAIMINMPIYSADVTLKSALIHWLMN